MLVHTPDAYIVNASVQLEDRSTISGKVITSGMDRGEEIVISLPEINVQARAKIDESGAARFSFPANVDLWLRIKSMTGLASENKHKQWKSNTLYSRGADWP